MAIDTNNGFIPNYVVPEDKKKVVKPFEKMLPKKHKLFG